MATARAAAAAAKAARGAASASASASALEDDGAAEEAEAEADEAEEAAGPAPPEADVPSLVLLTRKGLLKRTTVPLNVTKRGATVRAWPQAGRTAVREGLSCRRVAKPRAAALRAAGVGTQGRAEGRRGGRAGVRDGLLRGLSCR
jgi:hypothetical protein